MKNLMLVLLALLVGFLADRVVRLENQRHALVVGMCRYDAAEFLKGPNPNCLRTVQTRTSWAWHLFYALTDDVPPVPLFAVK